MGVNKKVHSARNISIIRARLPHPGLFGPDPHAPRSIQAREIDLSSSKLLSANGNKCARSSTSRSTLFLAALHARRHPTVAAWASSRSICETQNHEVAMMSLVRKRPPLMLQTLQRPNLSSRIRMSTPQSRGSSCSLRMNRFHQDRFAWRLFQG